MQRNNRNDKAAFTLVELLVVIAIISVLAGLLLPVFEGALSHSRNVACLNNLHQVSIAMLTYENDQNRLPASMHELYFGTGYSSTISYNDKDDVRPLYAPYTSLDIMNCPHVSWGDWSIELNRIPLKLHRLYSSYLLAPGALADTIGSPGSITPRERFTRSSQQYGHNGTQVNLLAADMLFYNPASLYMRLNHNTTNGTFALTESCQFPTASDSATWGARVFINSGAPDTRPEYSSSSVFTDGSAKLFQPGSERIALPVPWTYWSWNHGMSQLVGLR